jgi:VIT1/CCC1 family predicted Fe2+/Mn2+ transporter
MDTKNLLTRVLDSEMLAYSIYSKLSSTETDTNLRKKLKKLHDLDTRHLKIWEGIRADMNLPEPSHVHALEVAALVFVRRLFGKGLTISIVNSIENRKISDLSKVFPYIPDKYRPDVINYLVEELYQERLLKRDGLEGGILANIRNVVFGMNDGLVEVLAAVAGFTGVLHNNLLIAIAGSIVGLSGTISMAVGAYLSSKSEMDVETDGLNRLELELQVAKERLMGDLKKHSENYRRLDKSLDELIYKLKSFKDPVYKVLERERNNPLMKFLKGSNRIYEKSSKVGNNPLKDAVYVGAFYIVGAIIPLLSFLVGIATGADPYLNLVVSVVLTVVAISIVSAVIALNSNENISKYISKSVGLSIAATALTFIVGYVASFYLHVAV